jgi:hypothetical protein
MRLVRFQKNGGAALGIRLGDSIVDLSQAMPGAPDDLADLLRQGPAALAQAVEAARAAPVSAHIAP